MMTKNNIALLRRNAGMSQRELGEKLGVVQATISGWEIGRNEPDMSFIEQMAKIFGVSIGELMGIESLKPHKPLSFLEIKERQLYDSISRPDEELEIEEMFENERETVISVLHEEYLTKKLPIYFETYLINLAFDKMTKRERERALTILTNSFESQFDFANEG